MTDLRRREIEVQDQVSDQYEAKRYHAPHSRRYHIWWVEDMIAPTPDEGLWLELGCGTGWVHEVLQMRGSRRRLIGLDISMGMLRHAHRKQMTVLQGEASRLPFAANCFDGVLAKGVLHHVPDMAAAVEEIARVLKPGGLVVLAEPNLSPLRAFKYTLKNRNEHFSALHRAIRPSDLRRIVAASLAVTRLRYFGLLAYVAAFPDILPIGMTARRMDGLIRLDEKLARLPLVERFCWAFTLSAQKQGAGRRDGKSRV
jgi:ubiquinone/menaquinone biosynthesis C-methylase UbiE